MLKEIAIKMAEKNIYKKKKDRKFLRILLVIIFLSLMIFFYFVLVNLGINLFLVILMLAFASLIFIGSFFMKKRKRSIYSELFPEKKRNKIQRPRRIELKIQAESEVFEKPKFRDVNLDFKYRKTLINKCENCGMIITSYKKQCPICGNSIELKELIKKCSSCGMTIPKSTKKCPICGTRTI